MKDSSDLRPPPQQIREHAGPEEDEEPTGKRTSQQIFAEQIEHLRLRNKELRQNIDEREKYAKRVYGLVGWCLFGVAFFVFLQGFDDVDFQINDKVLIAIITSATANVIGLFIIIVKYLFGGEKEKKKSS